MLTVLSLPTKEKFVKDPAELSSSEPSSAISFCMYLFLMAGRSLSEL